MQQKQASERRLLDLKGITEYSGIPERFARRLLSERRLNVVKLGRRIFVWSHDLDAYLEANTLPVVVQGKA